METVRMLFLQLNKLFQKNFFADFFFYLFFLFEKLCECLFLFRLSFFFPSLFFFIFLLFFGFFGFDFGC
jgi:hypothetical protein